jgi:hypothetical protein
MFLNNNFRLRSSFTGKLQKASGTKALEKFKCHSLPTPFLAPAFTARDPYSFNLAKDATTI